MDEAQVFYDIATQYINKAKEIGDSGASFDIELGTQFFIARNFEAAADAILSDFGDTDEIEALYDDLMDELSEAI